MSILLLLIFIFSTYTSFSQVIPPDRQVNWYQTQYHFRFEEPQQTVNLLDYGAVGDGDTDNSDAFSDALDAVGNQPAIIYIPSGKYLFNSTLSLKSNIVLKGSGPGETVLLFDLEETNNHCIKITGSASSGYVDLDGGYFFGGDRLITDSAFLFPAGSMVEIREDNGNWDTHPVSWAKQVVGQMIMIDSVCADTLWLHSPLRIQYDSLLHPVIHRINPVENAAVECLKIQRLDEPESGGGYNIYFGYAHNCRIKGIESDTSVASHVYISKSLNIRVTGSYFHHAFRYDGASTHGYGVTLSHRASECVVENNIFEHLRHAMMVKTGANGNVFGYNYSTDVYRVEFPHDYGGDISLHGHYPYANLFEGNIVENIILDHYWGPAGPFNTFFRNRAYNWGIVFTTNNVLESTKQNVVGNEVTNTTVLHGKYSLSGSDHFEYGNNVKGTIIPEGTESLTDVSYYLYDWPTFWNIYCIWPSIGIPNPLNSGTLPAYERYQSGDNFTVCTDSLVDQIQKQKQQSLLVWPNPVKNELFIKIPQNSQSGTLEIFSLNGRKVYHTLVTGNEHFIHIKRGSLWNPGIYILRFISKKNSKTVKFYVQ